MNARVAVAVGDNASFVDTGGLPPALGMEAGRGTSERHTPARCAVRLLRRTSAELCGSPAPSSMSGRVRTAASTSTLSPRTVARSRQSGHARMPCHHERRARRSGRSDPRISPPAGKPELNRAHLPGHEGRAGVGRDPANATHRNPRCEDVIAGRGGDVRAQTSAKPGATELSPGRRGAAGFEDGRARDAAVVPLPEIDRAAVFEQAPWRERPAALPLCRSAAARFRARDQR
jgi:hypothetical protein